MSNQKELSKRDQYSKELKGLYLQYMEHYQEYKRKVISAYDEGKTMLKIADEIGISPITLNAFLEGKSVTVSTLRKVKTWTERNSK